MEIRIQSIHFDASEQLQAFIQKKAAKLEKYCDEIRKVEVSLKVVKPETAKNKRQELKSMFLIQTCMPRRCATHLKKL